MAVGEATARLLIGHLHAGSHSAVIRPVVGSAPAPAAFAPAAPARLDMLGEQPAAGLLRFDLDAQTLVEAGEPTLDALELRVPIDPDADAASTLGADPKGSRAGILRDDCAIEVPEAGLRRRCVHTKQHCSGEGRDYKQTSSLLAVCHLIPPRMGIETYRAIRRH
jgi:hypothetical protein